MQSIASVVFADLRARQIEQTLWSPTQHERLRKCTPMKKRERRNQSTALFVPSSSCGPVEPTATALRASICPDDLRKDPHHPGTFATSLRCGAAPILSAALAIVVPAPKRAPVHAGTLSNRISAAGIFWYAGTLRNIRADRRNNQKNLWLTSPADSSAASPVGAFL